MSASCRRRVAPPSERVFGLLAGVFAVAMGAGCGESASLKSSAGRESEGTGAATSGSNGAPSDPSSFGSGGGGPGPELEAERSFRVPVTTGRHIWAANPDTGRVAVVDAETLGVETLEAGFGPTHLAAVPGDGEAARVLVINTGSEDATLFERDPNGAFGATTIALHPGADAWTVDASGRWAIAWSDYRQRVSPDATEGFQDVSVIDLAAEPPTSTRLSVGYRPTSVVITSDASRAFVVTEPGLSVIELGASPSVARDIALSDPSDPGAPSPDVSITPDGAYAALRREGSPLVTVVDLVQGGRGVVALSGAVTDLDMTPDARHVVAVVRVSGGMPPPAPSPDAGEADAGGTDGAGVDAGGTDAGGADAGGTDARAGEAGLRDALVPEAGRPDAAAPADAGSLRDVAPALPPWPAGDTLFGHSTVAVLDIEQVLNGTATVVERVVGDEVVGSAAVPQAGNRALLYTTAVVSDRLSMLGLTDTGFGEELRTVRLKSPVQAVLPTTDGSHAIALLAADGSPGSAAPGAFAVVPVATALPPKMQATTAPPTAVALGATATGHAALITVRADVASVHGVYLARMPSLQVDYIELSRPPIATGVLEDIGMGFVAELHPEGRITVIDLVTGTARTLTGFELDARVVDAR